MAVTAAMLAGVSCRKASDQSQGAKTPAGSAAAADKAGEPGDSLSSQSQAEVSDSIPMEVTVTFSGGPLKDDGTHRAVGNGVYCRHSHNRAGEGAVEWSVRWDKVERDDAPVKIVDIKIGTLANGSSDQVLGQFAGAPVVRMGMQLNPVNIIESWGNETSPAYRAKATVTSQGSGVRIDVEGRSKTETNVKATVVCKKLSALEHP